KRNERCGGRRVGDPRRLVVGGRAVTAIKQNQRASDQRSGQPMLSHNISSAINLLDETGGDNLFSRATIDKAGRLRAPGFRIRQGHFFENQLQIFRENFRNFWKELYVEIVGRLDNIRGINASVTL